MKDLTNSLIERRNILNNNLAIQEIYTQIGFPGIPFGDEYHYTRQQIAQFFEIDEKTIERLVKKHFDELSISGYKIIKGTGLKEFKEILAMLNTNSNEIVGARAPTLSLFTFKALLNFAMLLTISERAKQLRSLMLDIVIDVLNEDFGGATKFVNQFQNEDLPSLVYDDKYRPKITNALNIYLENDWSKHRIFTDKIYSYIFDEKAQEYRQTLKLAEKDFNQESIYPKVLNQITEFENGFADFLQKESRNLGRKLTVHEARVLFNNFTQQMEDFCKPLREKARTLMASRDMAFRDALHEKLKDYVEAVSPEDFDKFLGERSRDFEKRLEENKEVFKRLKDR